MIYLFLADGFEEIEALATLDVLRRCGLDVTTVSINPTLQATGAHGVAVTADATFDSANYQEAQAIVLPGGMPGARNLLDHSGLRKVLLAQNARQGVVAAICAAPMVLGQNDLLNGRKATCYPGFEGMLTGATVESKLVVEDGHIITGRGPAAAIPFGCAIAARFVAPNVVADVLKGMLFE